MPSNYFSAEKMEKLQVVYRKVNDLIPYARNARTHSEEQVTRIASSIKEFGFTDSGVKRRRSGRGYKPRKPGADFI